MITFKNFRAKIDEAVKLEDVSDLSLDQLKKKFRRDLADYKKNGEFKNDKVEYIFFQWGMRNGEIRTDDYTEFEDMMDRIISEDKFEPHMMYDPKTGKGYMANTMDDHLRMKKLGYTHESK